MVDSNVDDVFDFNLGVIPQQSIKVNDALTSLPVLRGREEISPVWVRYKNKAKFCGGFIRWMVSPVLNPIPAGDIDLFPHTQEDYDFIVSDLKKHGLKEYSTTSVAKSFNRTESGVFAGVSPIQVIKPKNNKKLIAQGTLEEVLRGFDFTVVRAGLTSLDYALVDEDFVEDESNKFLRVKNIHCPIGSSLRFMKYSKKGYRSNAIEVLKLFNDWDSREETYRKELKEGIPKLVLTGENSLDDDQRQSLKELIYID